MYGKARPLTSTAAAKRYVWQGEAAQFHRGRKEVCMARYVWRGMYLLAIPSTQHNVDVLLASPSTQHKVDVMLAIPFT
eukprot:362362-Chlamydomonas_euryale.AAC.1